MHDLNTMARLNLESHAASIKRAQDRGFWVVALYDGVTLLSTELYPELAMAQAAMKAHFISPSMRRVLISPTPPERVIGARDQSEDYVWSRTIEQLAALGASSPS